MASPPIIGVCSDDLQCIVCYDLYKYPITLPCGHSFCCACLEKYWESRKQGTACVCPNCRKVFPQKPKFQKNVILAGMVERMKLTMKAVQPGVDVQQDGHVEHHCEVCFRTAAKRCVPCDTLCCEIHMKPHQHKGHKVVNPEVKLEELICANHGKPIQLYCKDDETMMCLMCQMCKDGKHKNHDVVTLESVHAELKDVLKTKCPEVSKSKQHLQSQLHQLQEEVEQTQHTGQSTEGRLEEKRRELYQLVDETVDLLMSRVIKRKNKKLSLFMKNIEKLRQQLKSVQEAESLLQTALQELEAIYFMQGFKDLTQRLESVSHFQYLKMAPHTVLDFFKEENKLNMLVELNRNFLKKIHKPVEPELSELEQSSLRSLYGRTPNLDPNSASPWILVSHDLKMATRTATDHPEPNHPDRFDVWEQVLSADSFFSGRHYWEVDVSLSRTWRIGVALNSMGRKGAGRNRLLGRNPESWCLQKYKKEYTALHNDQWTCLSLPGDAERFGFCLDCEAGELRCFVDSQVLHVFRGNFLDPVKPAIGVYQYDDDSVLFCSL